MHDLHKSIKLWYYRLVLNRPHAPRKGQRGNFESSFIWLHQLILEKMNYTTHSTNNVNSYKSIKQYQRTPHFYFINDKKRPNPFSWKKKNRIYVLWFFFLPKRKCIQNQHLEYWGIEREHFFCAKKSNSKAIVLIYHPSLCQRKSKNSSNCNKFQRSHEGVKKVIE